MDASGYPLENDRDATENIIENIEVELIGEIDLC